MNHKIMYQEMIIYPLKMETKIGSWSVKPFTTKARYMGFLIYRNQIHPALLNLAYSKIAQTRIYLSNFLDDYSGPQNHSLECISYRNHRNQAYSTALKLHPTECGFPNIVQDSRSTTFHQMPGTSYHSAPATPVGMSGSGAVT